jgi:signal transduction histidine kinase
VSHELRSPLTALVTSVDVLQRRRDEMPEQSRQALDLIDRDLRRFQRALEDLLELGRLEAGAAGSVTTTVDARDLVRHALESGGRSAELLRLPGDDTEICVSVDKSQMHRALVNLFENADRHGGGLTGVAVSAAPGGVLISVEDEGPGVAPADRERIFERFVRGGSRGSLPGTGLGLSLVAETVRAHGGAVWCVPGPGGAGARFVVRLPSVERGSS